MDKRTVLILRPGEKLNEEQNVQFINIMYDAYKSKFQKEMGDDPDTVKKILDLMVKSNLFPLENRICAVDGETGEIVGFILLSRFEDVSISCLIKFVFSLFSMVNFKKAVKLIKAFFMLDSLNAKSKKSCTADIYLIASKEEFRGHGIGTLLMEAGLRHVKESFAIEDGKHRISLIVYKDNPAVRLYKKFGFEVVETFNTEPLAEVMGAEFGTHLMMHKSLI